MMRSLNNNLVSLWIVFAIAVGIGSWFSATEPTATRATVQAGQPWELPKLPENQSRKSMDNITARNLWGVAAAFNAPPAPKWSIQGIARSGTERFVLLSFEGRPMEILKVGDLLPDGTKIVQIDDDRFLVQTSNKERIAFGIYKNETAK